MRLRRRFGAEVLGFPSAGLPPTGGPSLSFGHGSAFRKVLRLRHSPPHVLLDLRELPRRCPGMVPGLEPVPPRMKDLAKVANVFCLTIGFLLTSWTASSSFLFFSTGMVTSTSFLSSCSCICAPIHFMISAQGLLQFYWEPDHCCPDQEVAAAAASMSPSSTTAASST